MLEVDYSGETNDYYIDGERVDTAQAKTKLTEMGFPQDLV